MSRQRLIAWTAALAAVAGSLIGCGSSPEEPTADSGTKGVPPSPQDQLKPPPDFKPGGGKGLGGTAKAPN